MSAGKEAARDLRYGRRGGGWAGEQRADGALAAIRKIRLSSVRADAQLTLDEYNDPKIRKWPAESLELWRQIATGPSDHPLHEHALEVIAASRR